MAMIIYATESRNLQVNTSLFLTLIVIAYMLHVKPFAEPSMNKQEIINETSVLVASYLLYLYTEYVSDAEMRYNLGWVHVGILGINLLINLSIMARVTVMSCKLKFKRKAAMKRHKKLMEERKDKLIKRQQEEISRRERLIAMFPDMLEVLDGESSDEIEQEKRRNKA